MPRQLTHEAGEYRVMSSLLGVLTGGRPGSVENPASYDWYERGDVVELSAEDASRHAAHTLPVFVNPDSTFDRRVRLVPTVVPVGSEDDVLANAPAPAGVAVVVPPDETPASALGASGTPPGRPDLPPGGETESNPQGPGPTEGPVLRPPG